MITLERLFRVVPLLLILLTPLVSRADFTFVHATDLHVNARQEATSNAARDARMYDEISALNPRPAFVVQTGDIVEIGTAAEFRAYHQALEHLKIPHYDAPGNHDVRWNPMGKEGYVSGVGQPLYQSWDYQNVHFVTLDSTVLLQHWGHISQEQLDWLKADLQKVGPDRPVVMAFHHWIGREDIQVDNQQKLMDVVEPYNVVLWLQGHGHGNIQWSINGVAAIMQGVLLEGNYAVIDVTADTITVRRRQPGPKPTTSTTQSAEPTPTYSQILTIPLKKRAMPMWNASATLGGKLVVAAEGADLPADAHLTYRINTGKELPMTGEGGRWTAQSDASSLMAGEHVITVQATLADGRAYQKPVSVTVKRPDVPSPLCKTDLNSAVQSKLVRWGDSLFVTTMGGECIAMDPATGKIRWRFATEGPAFSTPEVSDGVVYFGSADHHVYALDATTGQVKWKYKTEGAIFAGPAVAAGMVVVPSVDLKIYGLDASTGERKWTLPVDGMVQSKCATDGQLVFIGDWANTLRAIDAAAGREVWQVKMGRAPSGSIATPYSPAISAPAVGDGKVYVATNDGVLHAIDARTGKIAWEWWEKGKNRLGYSGPLFHSGRIYLAIGSEGRTFCLEAQTGELVWTCDTGSVIYDSSFTFAAGKVFIGCVSGQFNAIDAATGKLVWAYRLAPGHLLASPASDESRVFIVSMNGQVIALPAASLP